MFLTSNPPNFQCDRDRQSLIKQVQEVGESTETAAPKPPAPNPQPNPQISQQQQQQIQRGDMTGIRESDYKHVFARSSVGMVSALHGIF